VARTVFRAIRVDGDITEKVRRLPHDDSVMDRRRYSDRVIAASPLIALALLALEPAPTGPSSKPCPPTSFAGAAAFLAASSAMPKERDALTAARRARARKLEATVVRGELFEKMGPGFFVVYGAFAVEADAAAWVATLAKKKIAASVVASGAPVAPAPIVRVCGDARRAEWGAEKGPTDDLRFSRFPIDVQVGDAHLVTETDGREYFELWLAGAGRVHVQIAPFKPEKRDRNQWCGSMGMIQGMTPIGDEADFELPKAAGASIRTRLLGQTVTICAE
jgi:hypothetical protein